MIRERVGAGDTPLCSGELKMRETWAGWWAREDDVIVADKGDGKEGACPNENRGNEIWVAFDWLSDIPFLALQGGEIGV